MMNLQEVSDRLEIDKLVKTYYRAVDRTDFDLVRSCFFADAQIAFAVFFSGDLDEFIEFLRGPTGMGGHVRSFHHAANTIIEIDGDVARTEVYVVAYHEMVPGQWGGGFLVVWQRYLDRLERRDGEWRIVHRRTAIEWVRQDTAGMWTEMPPEALGRRDRDDALYAE